MGGIGVVAARGWAATRVRSIAEEAGVSVKTIYDTFGSKAELFKAVVDVAAAGDDEAVAVMGREQFAALADGDLPQRAAAGARLAARVNRRTVDLRAGDVGGLRMSRVARTGSVQADVQSTPAQVWQVLTDVTRIGEWSHECRTAQWLGGADQAAVGARFRGTNKARFARWSRPCTISVLDSARRFTYRTNGGLMGDATEWTFTLEPTDRGCRITQSCEIISLPRAAEWAISKMLPEHVDRTQALREDLERLGAVAAA